MSFLLFQDKKRLGERITAGGLVEIVAEYHVGDVISLKKKHPCGSFDWEILRVGADFRLKCMGCGHQVMMARTVVEKKTKTICISDGSKASEGGCV
jgi:hypothetical protein